MMTPEQATRLGAILSGQTESTADKLAEISRDLADLSDRLARVMGVPAGRQGHYQPASYVGMGALVVTVERAAFDLIDGPVFENHDAIYPNGFYWRYPATGIVAYCFQPPAPDHDLTAENAPDEWAASTDYNHFFWRYSPVLGAEDIWTRVIDR